MYYNTKADTDTEYRIVASLVLFVVKSWLFLIRAVLLVCVGAFIPVFKIAEWMCANCLKEI